MNTPAPKPNPQLVLTLSYDHDGKFLGTVGWSWRNGRCAKNGIVSDSTFDGGLLADRATWHATQAFDAWLADAHLAPKD